MGPAVSGAGDRFEGMRRVGCGCEVPKTGFWDVGSLPNRLLKNSILILGGAAVHRCANRLVFSTGFSR
jgi:hypothetical protein